MERLLKIIEGPMKGAEVALVSGTRIKIGSGDECDIIIADASLPAVAFELDVAEEAVSLITADGETRALKEFEIHEFGSTAIAIGPADGAWGELYRPAPKDETPAEEATETPEKASAEESASAAAPKEAAVPEKAKAKKNHAGLWGFVGGLIVLLVLLVIAFFFFRGCVKKGPSDVAVSDQKVVTAPQTIDEIARAHGLRVEVRDGQSYLVGNLKRRTERMAIRALALSTDRLIRFDLTDDQSLKNAVADTLFIAADGRLTVSVVTNRVAVLEGVVSGPGELATILKMLNQDVPQLASCVTTGVSSSLSGDLAGAPVARAAARGNSSASTPAAFAPHLPVAGILTSPYPCVVLMDGSRCLEGAHIGGLVLEKIDEEELVFVSVEGAVLKWRP